MLNFFDAVTSVAALVWALAVGACLFLAIDWNGLFEAKYIKVFLVVAIIAQATLFIIKKIGAVLYCGMFASLTISVLGMIENLYLYAYLAIMVAAMFGMTKRYHR